MGFSYYPENVLVFARLTFSMSTINLAHQFLGVVTYRTYIGGAPSPASFPEVPWLPLLRAETVPGNNRKRENKTPMSEAHQEGQPSLRPQDVPELSLAIPLYNEQDNVENVVTNLVAALEAAHVDYELVLVNNGSEDRTGEIIERLARENHRLVPVHIPVNQGYGWGIITGLKHCRGRYLGYAWGDNQVRAEDVVKIFDRLRQGDVDMVKALRIERHDGLQRLIITRVYNTVFPFFFPVYSKDVNGCPKIFTREAYEAIAPKSRDWFLDAEIMIKAHKLGLRVAEIPVIFYPRSSGKSKVRWKTVLEFALNMIRYRLGGGL